MKNENSRLIKKLLSNSLRGMPLNNFKTCNNLILLNIKMFRNFQLQVLSSVKKNTYDLFSPCARRIFKKSSKQAFNHLTLPIGLFTKDESVRPG